MRSKYGSPGFARAPAVPGWARRNPRKGGGNLARHVLMYDLPTKELPSEADRDQLRNFEVVDARILHLGETPSLAANPTHPAARARRRRSRGSSPEPSCAQYQLARPADTGKIVALEQAAEFAAHRSVGAPSCARPKWPRRTSCDQAPARRPLSHPVGSRRLDDLRSTGRSRRGDLPGTGRRRADALAGRSGVEQVCTQIKERRQERFSVESNGAFVRLPCAAASRDLRADQAPIRMPATGGASSCSSGAEPSSAN
jgi:hypothetical protein